MLLLYTESGQYHAVILLVLQLQQPNPLRFFFIKPYSSTCLVTIGFLDVEATIGNDEMWPYYSHVNQPLVYEFHHPYIR